VQVFKASKQASEQRKAKQSKASRLPVFMVWELKHGDGGRLFALIFDL
jgi:hypothetical protein